MTPVKDAARRLLKSRLRRHLALALSLEHKDQAWTAASEVEEGISEEALEDWKLARSFHTATELAELVHEAVAEAATGVRQHFEGMAPDEWLDEQIRLYVETFQVNQFLSEA